MALTSDQWRKIKDNSQAYGSLTEQNKKKFWEFGVSNGLVDFQNLKPENVNKLTQRFGVTQDFYDAKYLKRSTEKDQKEQDIEIRKDEDRFATDYIPTETSKVQSQADAKRSIQLGTEIGSKEYTSLPSTRKPYTTAPVPQQVVQPNLALANRMQNLKESSLEPQKPTIRNPFNFKDITQGSRGVLTPQAQRIALEQTPAAVAGTLGGIGASFGIKGTPEQEAYLRETKPGYGAYSIGGQIAGQIAGYGVVNSALKGTKLGATLVSTLGKKLGTKVGGYVASQGAQLLADAIVQAPTETVEAIQNDKSIGEDVKQILTNRAIDLAMNMAIQGGSDALQKMLANKKVAQTLVESGVNQADVVKAVKTNDTSMLDAIRQKLNITPVEGKTIVKQGLQEPSLLQKIRQASGVSPFGDATQQAQKQVVPSIKPIEQPVVEATKPIAPTLKPIDVPVAKEVDAPIMPVKKYADDVQSKLDEIDAIFKERKDLINTSNADKELKAKQLKAIGMEKSAERRKAIQGDSFEAVDGGLTPKELKNKIDKEATNYQGKKVTTPDGNGTLTGKNPFGKVGVTLENGEVKFYDNTQVKSINKITPSIKPVLQDAPQQTIQPISKQIEKPIVKTVEQTPTPKLPSTPEVTQKPLKFIDTAKKAEATTDEVRSRLKQIETASTSDKARMDLAKKFVEDDLEGSLKVVREGNKFESSVEGAVAIELYGKLQKAGRYDDAAEVIEALARKGKASGQEVQMLSVLSKTTPEGMVKWATKTLKDADIDVDQKLIKQVYDETKSINEMTPEELSKLITSKIKNKKERQAIEGFINSQGDDVAKQYAIGQTMSEVFKRLPISSARKVSTFQAMSHLLNAKTFMRNILGNVSSVTLEQLNKLPASVIDRGLSVLTKKRTLVANMPRWKESLGEAIREGKKSYAEIRLGVNRANAGKYDMFYESAFDGKGIGNKLGRVGEQALQISLQTPDEAFKGFLKADSVYNQVRARLGKEVDSWEFNKILDNATTKEIETAVDEAKFATFQNDSLPAKILVELKKTLNQIGYGKTLPSGMKEFGVGDLVIKYTRVPGNLIARGVEYSPVGSLKALTLIGDLDKNQRQLAQVLGRALTGTSLMYLGKVLADNGLITVEKDQTTDERQLEKSEGLGGMKINTSAIGRLLTGQSTEKRAGDKYASYDWIQPVNTPIAIGTKLADKKITELTSQEITDLVSAATFEQASDLPTMFIIKQMMTEQQRGSDAMEIASIPFQEALPGFVPSVIRQAAQFIDPVIRETKGATRQETTKNKLIANIPFASRQLQPKLSPLGQEQKREVGVIKSLINPSTVTTYIPSGITDKLEKVKEMTGKTNFYPNAYPPNTIKFYKKGNKEQQTTPLSAEEKTLYQKTYGEYVKREYEKTLAKAQFTNKERTELIADILSEIESNARANAVAEILKKRGIR